MFVLARKESGWIWIYASLRRFKTQKSADTYRKTLSKKKGEIYILNSEAYKIFDSLEDAWNWSRRDDVQRK